LIAFADIKRSLADGGVLCCTLFGTDDTWSGDSKKTFHTRARVESLVSDLKLIALSEDEWDGMPAVGPRKHWHVFFIIAQKPGKGAEHERGWSRPSGKTMPQAENDGWSKFHELTKEAPTSRLLVGAIEQLGRTGKAIDIGAGAFKDTRHLLAGGFDVTAIDSAPASSEAAKAIVSPKLRFVATAFDHFDFPEAEYDLASAMYALPFNPPETFDRLFAGITRSLVSGGVFCGTFFGTRDEWSGERNMTFHTRQQVKTLLSGLTLIRLSEDERDGTTADGTLKHWHVFYVTCRKP
jgi:tellurite methyltransferase